jgi:hypothetical protein
MWLIIFKWMNRNDFIIQLQKYVHILKQLMNNDYEKITISSIAGRFILDVNDINRNLEKRE